MRFPARTNEIADTKEKRERTRRRGFKRERRQSAESRTIAVRAQNSNAQTQTPSTPSSAQLIQKHRQQQTVIQHKTHHGEGAVDNRAHSRVRHTSDAHNVGEEAAQRKHKQVRQRTTFDQESFTARTSRARQARGRPGTARFERAKHASRTADGEHPATRKAKLTGMWSVCGPTR